MIRVVLDTNIVISGLLWSGTPKQIINAAQQGHITALMSEEMIDELRDVLERPKFAPRLQSIGKRADQLVASYLEIVSVVEAAIIAPIITADPDDDAIIECAIGGKADYIASGDQHLLTLKSYENILIVTAEELLLYIRSDEQ